mgnify:CR=1 FL=1
MKTTRLVEFGFHKCDNCESIHHATELNDIKDFGLRVTAGSTVPSGECPNEDCGSLCYPIEEGKIVEGVMDRRII